MTACPRRHSGAALLTAMLTVTLVASIAAAALLQQWRNVEIEAAERTRVQSRWILTGALDWGRLILREDARSGGADHLGEPWAIPLEEARLSTFLATDRNKTEDSGADIFLSGRISDLQSRMNVRNLVDGANISKPAQQAFGKLFEHLGLPPGELTTLTNNLLAALEIRDGRPAANAALLPQRVSQLTWLGLSRGSLLALQPFITLLPVPTPVNLNTADAIVLYACIPTLDMAQAQQLVSNRQMQHFRALPEVNRLFGDTLVLNDQMHSVSSRFFEVHGRLRMEKAVVEEHSVVQREGLTVRTLWRDRAAPARTEAPAS
ncbi:MAG: type II secretion system minor pseudopilin GspK [Rhodoferax sp.]|nr:type II secretion system minor pseudopilin GspK [Rhodoferax sp.]